MTIVSALPSSVNCRRAQVPACEAQDIATEPSFVADATLFVKKGDIIDVGIDWSVWLAANDGKVSVSAWAEHGSSPQSPTLGDDAKNDTKMETFVLVDASAATVGDVYYITNTVTVVDATQTGDGDIPSRTLKRNIKVKVVA